MRQREVFAAFLAANRHDSFFQSNPGRNTASFLFFLEPRESTETLDYFRRVLAPPCTRTLPFPSGTAGAVLPACAFWRFGFAGLASGAMSNPKRAERSSPPRTFLAAGAF